jgi:TldD protein
MTVLDPAAGARPAPPRRTNATLYTDADPLSLVPFAKKVALCQQIDAAARARDPRVVQASVSLAGSWSVIEIVRPGRLRRPRRPAAGPPQRPARRRAERRRETGYHGLGGRYLYDDLFQPRPGTARSTSPSPRRW